MESIIDSVMISRFYTRETRDAIAEDILDAVKRLIRTLDTMPNTNAVKRIATIPSVIESVNPDGSGTGNFIVTTSGSPTYLAFFKEQFGVSDEKRGGLQSYWKVVSKKPIQISPLVQSARITDSAVERLGTLEHGTDTRFAASNANARRAMNTSTTLARFISNPTIEDAAEVMDILHLGESDKQRLLRNIRNQWRDVRTILTSAVRRELTRQRSGAAKAEAAFAGATGAMDPAARAVASASARAADAARNVNARALRPTTRHVIPPEDLALLTAAEGGYRNTKRRVSKNRKTKNRRTH